jgi:hypothetical protein
MEGELSMPIAVSSSSDTFRFDLKSAPPDGFVELRKMNHGEKLFRREKMAKMSMQRQSRGGESEMTVDMQMETVTIFEFSRSIVDHNLEDVDGRKLNFKNAADVLKLDGNVGAEIEDLIDKLNEPPAAEKPGNDDPLPGTSGFSSTPSLTSVQS